jgi:probable HAF family extracellular repeat protein
VKPKIIIGSMLCALLVLIVIVRVEGAVRKRQPLLIELPLNFLATDVGANGFVVIGSIYNGGAFHWMPTSGVTPIGGYQGVAVSRDGKTIIGVAKDQHGIENAAIWTGGTNWRLLGSFTPDAQPCDALLSSAFGASDDGSVIVGLGWNSCNFARAFRWEQQTGMIDLGSTVAGRSSRANNVSGDGRIVIGWQEDPTGVRRGAKWVNGVQEIIQGPNGAVGEAFGSNRDGSIIVGTICDYTDTVISSAWKWTPMGIECFPVKRPSNLPDKPYRPIMFATSENGRVIGGSFSFGLDSESLVWLDGQVNFLKDYLRKNGVPDAFEGWVNTGFVLNVSRDGRILVGYGAGPRAFQGFMVVLPE